MIVGSKVLIRAVEEEDWPVIHKWYNRFELKELFEFTIDFANYEEFVKAMKERERDRSIIDFAIIEKDSRKPVGECILTDIDLVNRRSGCILYIGESENLDKEYGVEAMEHLMKFVFESLNLNRLALWVFDFNKWAIKVYKQCGMKVEGIMREGIYRGGRYHDVYLMGILKSEYVDMVKGGHEVCLEESM